MDRGIKYKIVSYTNSNLLTLMICAMKVTVVQYNFSHPTF